MISLRVMIVFMALAGIALAAFGLRGFLVKKPLVVSNSLFVWPLLVFLILYAASGVEMFLAYPGSGINWMTVFPIAIFVVVVFVLFRQPPTYMVMGVAEDSLYSALREALTRLNLPYEETGLRLKLTSLDTYLRVAFSPAVGTGTLHMAERKHASTLKTIAGTLRQSLVAAPGVANWTMAIVYAVMGVIMVVFAVYLWWITRF